MACTFERHSISFTGTERFIGTSDAPQQDLRHDPYWTGESAEKQSCQEIAQGSPACKCPISIATQLHRSCYYCTPSLGRQGKGCQKNHRINTDVERRERGEWEGGVPGKMASPEQAEGGRKIKTFITKLAKLQTNIKASLEVSPKWVVWWGCAGHSKHRGILGNKKSLRLWGHRLPDHTVRKRGRFPLQGRRTVGLMRTCVGMLLLW